MATTLILLLAVVTLVHGEIDYCSVCDPPGIHTACMFPKAGPGGNCTKYTPSPLTPEEKELLLDIHNRLRSKVARGQGWVVNSTYDAQPKAADMRQLYWDDELELIAQRWADQCLPFYTTTPHDLCRDSPRFPVGQNIVTSAYSQPMPSDVEARTLDWYNEIKDFNPQWVGRFFQNPNPDPAKQTGHYTQLVWGWTHLLGCGRVIFEEEFEGTKWSVERIVCNYAPGGNFLSFPVYKTGEPCSKCPPGTQCSSKYTGLCALHLPVMEAGDKNIRHQEESYASIGLMVKRDKHSEVESNETDGGIVLRLAELTATTEVPVTWQYWRPGKFWVVPNHLSESPEEMQQYFTSVPPQEFFSSSPVPLTTSSAASPQSDSFLSTSPPPPLPPPSSQPKEDKPVTQQPIPSQKPPSSEPLKDFLFKFTSIPLFNTTKFTSISWVELPKLSPRELLDLLSSSPVLGHLNISPPQSQSPQGQSSSSLSSLPRLPSMPLLPPLIPSTMGSQQSSSFLPPPNSPSPWLLPPNTIASPEEPSLVQSTLSSSSPPSLGDKEELSQMTLLAVSSEETSPTEQSLPSSSSP